MSEAYHMARASEEPGFKYLEHIQTNIRRSAVDGLKTLEYDLPASTTVREHTSILRLLRDKGYDVSEMDSAPSYQFNKILISWEKA